MSQLKQRLPSTKKHLFDSGSGSDSDSDSDSKHDNKPLSTSTSATTTTVPPIIPSQGQPSKAQRVVSQTLASTAYLANLLPTGTLLAFQLLTPVFTNNGQCDVATRSMTAVLLATLAISCFLACLTDSVQGSNGQVYYGLATFKGIWLFDCPSDLNPDHEHLNLEKYKLRFIDWVHALLSMLVFGVVSLRDKNVVNCFYPKPSHEIQEVLDIIPVGVGLICSLLFVVFPTRRHGIGYPITPRQNNDD